MPENKNIPNINFDEFPKTLYDGCVTGFSKHWITFAIFSGKTVPAVFALLPEDAVNMLKVMGSTLEKYVAVHGPIPDSSKPIPSPVDLSKPPQ